MEVEFRKQFTILEFTVCGSTTPFPEDKTYPSLRTNIPFPEDKPSISLKTNHPFL